MSFRRSTFVLSLFSFVLSAAVHAGPINWPGKAKAAVSLSYDDALHSQLDNAVPALTKYGIKVSFYPILSSPVVVERMTEWRKLAADGHELGNHTLFHSCAKSKPGRDWVPAYNDLDKKVMGQMRDELLTANAFLHALDGKTERTLTPPCLDWELADGNYVENLGNLFVGVKGAEKIAAEQTALLMPDGHSGKQLIDFVKKSAQKGGLVQIIFHGVGGDHLSVSKEAHEELLRFLAENRTVYWTDTYLNISKHLAAGSK